MSPTPPLHLIVRLCYRLDDSARYRRCKRFAYDLLENPDSPLRPYVDVTMCVLILATVFLMIYEVRHPLGELARGFEDAVIGVFIVEYLARGWLYSDVRRSVIEAHEEAEFLGIRLQLRPVLARVLRRKWDYVRSPLAIIDLLAILPSYRPLRLLRFFLLFRVFKLFRYTRAISEFAKVLAEKRFDLYTLAMFIGFVLFASATAIYIFEAHVETSHINTLFDAVYWAVITLFTVGYGDITPKTPEGRLVAMLLVVTGVAVISLSTSIVVTAFGEKMQALRDRRVFADVDKLRDYVIVCGYGRVGEMVVARLAEQKRPFVIVDKLAPNIARAKACGHLALCEDATQAEVLANLGITRHAGSILCITGDDVTNTYITLSARQMNPRLSVISRANRAETIHKLRLAGATHVVMPYEVVGLMAAEYIHQPVASMALAGILSGERGMSIDIVAVPPRSLLAGQRIGAIALARHKLTLLGVLTGVDGGAERDVRGAIELRASLQGRRFCFNPPPDFSLCAEDLLVVLGRSVSIEHFRAQVEGSALHAGAGA